MNEWMEHPDLANLDPLKQELIRTAALKAGGKNGKALVPVMMSLIAGANKRGIRFTPDEISLILSAIKEGKSKQEQAAASKLRMEERGEKLERAKDKLAKQKPPKKPGPVRRIGRAAGGAAHGFVHGKIYENEQ